MTGATPVAACAAASRPRSVVIPGVRPSATFPAGTYGVPCALIIGSARESTDRKTSLNDALRDFGVSV